MLIATRNLAMMIGFHALYNAPVPLIAAAPGVPRLGSRVAVVVVGMVFMAVWLWYLYRRSEKSTAIPEVSVVLKPDRIPASGG